MDALLLGPGLGRDVHREAFSKNHDRSPPPLGALYASHTPDLGVLACMRLAHTLDRLVGQRTAPEAVAVYVWPRLGLLQRWSRHRYSIVATVSRSVGASRARFLEPATLSPVGNRLEGRGPRT